jgi:hypothetical protein
MSLFRRDDRSPAPRAELAATGHAEGAIDAPRVVIPRGLLSRAGSR